MPENPARRGPRLAGALLAASAALLVVPARGAAGDPPPEDWSIERADREAELAPGATIEIENLHGDLRVRVGGPGRLEAHAVIQRHAKDPRAAAIEIASSSAGARLFIALDATPVKGAESGWNRRRVDLAVAVPVGAPLRLRTGSGLIEVKGGVGDLDIDSMSGDVRLWIESACRVRTERGSIVANLLGEPWARPARFETVTGAIEVELPAGTDALLRAETSGRLTTDYSLEVAWLGRLRKSATARLGAGGPEVVLLSQNGPVAILRRLPPAAAAEGLAESDRLRYPR